MKLVWCLILFFVLNNVRCDEPSLKELLNGTNIKLSCDKKPCLIKCCPLDQFVVKKRCKPLVVPPEKHVKIYTNVERDFEESRHSLDQLFTIIPGMFKINRQFQRDAINVLKVYPDVNFYLTEKGVLYRDMPNHYFRWQKYPNNEFCFDHVIEEGVLEPRFWIILPEDLPENETKEFIFSFAMGVSSFFLLLVLVAYSLLPELRNLCGMILMAYVASLCAAFTLLLVIRSTTIEVEYCIHFTCVIYYSFLAAFCWMSVMSYDIWWTFRGYAKARQIHRRGETFKFIMYSIYAFGVPLAMTIFLATINSAELQDRPWIIKPNVPLNGCFIDNGEKLLYLYYPMLILIIGNWMFYLMTAFNVWRLSRGTAVLDSAAAGTPAAHRSQKHRFLVYLKLSIVMGLNWVLEVVSFTYPKLSGWWISDIYNLLIGVSIFIIFVCKPKILRKLEKRVKYLYQKCKNSQTWQPSNSTRSHTSATDSSTSQETQTLQVCLNPKGPANNINNF